MNGKAAVLILIISVLSILPIFPQSIDVQNLTYEEGKYQGKSGLKFFIRDLYLYGAIGRKVYFAFAIFQDDWLKGSWTELGAVNVPYSETYWEDAGWFFYPSDYLKEQGGTNKDFTGYFFVMDAKTDKELGSYQIDFTTKTIYDFFLENYNRLKKHPQSENYYMDYKLAGKWTFSDLGPDKSYSIIVNDLELSPKGYAALDKAQWSLMKNGTMKVTARESYKAIWAVIADYTEKGDPVTLLKLVFPQDGSYIYFYYVYNQGRVTCVEFDPASQVASDKPLVFYEQGGWYATWKSGGSEKIADAIMGMYEADQYVANVELQNYMMGSMVNNYMFSSFSNTLAGLSPSGIAYY